MALNIKSSGLFVANMNNKPVMNKQYVIDIDNTRIPTNQVLAMYNNNGYVKSAHDSLQNYIKNMNTKRRSIFDLLNQERYEVKKINNIDASHVKPIKQHIKPIKHNSRKLRRNKPSHNAPSHNAPSHNAPSQGLSSKIFDFATSITGNNTGNNRNTFFTNRSRKKRRNKRTRKSYKKIRK